MTIWIQVNRATKFMDFMIEMTCKRSNAASHYVNNWMWDVILLDMITASLQCSHIIVNRLSRANLRNVNLKAVRIVKFKFMVVDFSHTIKFSFIHAAVTIGFAGNVIFNVLLVLVMLRELIHKGLIAAICSQ